MSNTHFLPLLPSGASVDEVLALFGRHYTPNGNDLDLLTQSMMLIQAGHYREAMAFAMRVQTPPSEIREPPQAVDKGMAQAAHLAASDRARPLYEQAAFEIEGVVEGSHTMATYDMIMEMLRSDPNW